MDKDDCAPLQFLVAGYMGSKSQFSLHKYSATENDFLIGQLLNDEDSMAWTKAFGVLPRAKVAQRLCDRFNGIGADGLLLIQPSQSDDFHWDFYNRDGSSAEMCGNAARCAALWADNLTKKAVTKFGTLAGPVVVSKHNDSLFEVQMTPLIDHNKDLVLSLGPDLANVRWLNSGVPHAVVERHSLEPRPELFQWANQLRRHSHFGPQGANVTFYTRLTPTRISSLTFERGVEDFTRSCGTGAVAAAWAAGESDIDVQVPGGDLRVEFSNLNSKVVPRLIGPAHYVGQFTPSSEFLGALSK